MPEHTNNDLSANMVRRSASALAGYAATDLLDAHLAAAEAFGADPLRMWHHWLTGRVEELASSIAVARPELFVDQIQWGRAILEARGIDPTCFKAGIECLRQVLMKELPEAARGTAVGASLVQVVKDLFDLQLDVGRGDE